MFRILWQVWLGEIGNKDVKNANKIKKTNSKYWNLWRILDFKYLYFLEKRSMIFQIFFTKSLFYKIKEHKNFQSLLKSTDGRNWKENVKDIRKIKKQIINWRNLKKKYFTYIYFCKRTFFWKKKLQFCRIFW